MKKPFFTDCEGIVNLAVDNYEVDKFGFINLGECFEKGIIPGSADFTDESFNGVQNPGTLMYHNVDVFDGIRKAEYVRSYLSKMNAQEREKAENALNRASEKSGYVETSTDVTS